MKPFLQSRASSAGRITCDRFTWARLGCLACAWPGAALAQASQPGHAIETSGWLLTPIVVVGLIAACAWAALRVIKQRRGGLNSGAGSLRVVGATALGARERAVVLQAGERTFLLGVTAQSVSVIAELDRASPAPSKDQIDRIDAAPH
jgi:flagellar protein FliO/FliZ